MQAFFCDTQSVSCCSIFVILAVLAILHEWPITSGFCQLTHIMRRASLNAPMVYLLAGYLDKLLLVARLCCSSFFVAPLRCATARGGIHTSIFFALKREEKRRSLRCPFDCAQGFGPRPQARMRDGPFDSFATLSCSPVGHPRWLRGLPKLRELQPSGQNKVRASR
jgi:hypothetical protein